MGIQVLTHIFIMSERSNTLTAYFLAVIEHTQFCQGGSPLL
jgi:hypothetical protein